MDFFKILTTPKAIKAASRWMIDSGALGQYSLAQEQLLIDDRQLKKELEVEERLKARMVADRLGGIQGKAKEKARL